MNGSEHSVPRPAREEQALREVGRTAVSRPVAAALAALFLATAFAVLAAEQVGVALSPEADLWPAWGTLRGRLAEALREEGLLGANRTLLAEIAAFEERLEEGSLLVERVVPWAQWAETAWLGTGNRQAYVGPARDGEWWLFYRPDVAYVTGPPFLAPEVLEARRAAADSWEPVVRPDPRPAILAFAAQLAARGIDLVVVPTPVKPSIHPERLAGEGSGWPVPLQNPSFDELVRELEAAGVEVLDPAPWLARAARETGRPQYLAADTHWTPEAVDRVAEALARVLADRLPAPSIDAGGPAGETAPAAYYRQPVRVRGVGDLVRMLRLPQAPGLPALFPPQEVTVQQVLDPLGSLARPEPGADVLLLGDSFTNVYSQAELGWGQGAGLAEQLAYRLGRPVDRIAVNAGGSHTTRERLADLLRADPGRLDGTRVVVYQFAVRELSQGDWKLIDLPGPTVARTGGRRPSPGVTLRGSDPALDGIAGPTAGPADEPLVSVWGANVSGSFFVTEEAQFAVEIHDLGLRDNDGPGLAVWGSLVQAKNVSITDNAGAGVHASGASGLHLIDAVVSGNADVGINVTRSSFMLCEGCTVEENGGDGVRGLNGAQLNILESTIADNGLFGVRALASANVTVVDSTIVGELGVGGASRARVTGSSTSVLATDQAFWFTTSDLQWDTSSFEGAMRINKDAYARLIGCTQTTNPGENFFAEDATLDLQGGTLAGTTRLVRFATGSVLGGATLGDLVCGSGADATCDGSETKSSSSCTLCP